MPNINIKTCTALDSAKREEIFHLAKSGDLSKVKELLLNDLNPNLKNEIGKDLLFTVIKEWHSFRYKVGGVLALIDFLVDEIGIDVNTTRDKYGNSLLSTAVSKVECRIGRWSKEQQSIEHLRHVQYQYLERSTIKERDDGGLEVISEHNAGIVAHLLSKGAKPDLTKKLSRSAVEEVMFTSNIEQSSPASITEALLLEGESTNTPICFTIERGLLCTTRLLLEAGSNINVTDRFGNTLLQLVALWYGSTVPNTYRDVAELLIEHGVDLNQKGNRSEYPIITILNKIKAKHPDELNSMLEKLGKQKHTMNSELKSKIESKFGNLDIGASYDDTLSGKDETCVIVTEKGVMNYDRGASSVASQMHDITVDSVDKSKGTVREGVSMNMSH